MTGARVAPAKRLVVARDAVEVRETQHSVGRLDAGDDRGFDAPGIQAVVGPVTRQPEVGVSTGIRAQPQACGAREREHVSIGRVDVGAEILRVEAGVTDEVIGTAEQLPPEVVVCDRPRPEMSYVAAQERDRVVAKASVMTTRIPDIVCARRITRFEHVTEVRDGRRRIAVRPSLDGDEL